MRFKKTVIFGFILLALASYVYLFEMRGAQQREEAERASQEVVSFDTDEVEELKLVHDDETIHCVRDSGDVWRLVDPLATEGSADDIKRILSTVKDATIRRTVADSAERLADYGLSRPQVTVSVRHQGEQEWRSVTLGDRNPTGTYAYAKRDGEPAVFLVSSSLLNSLDKSPDDLRFRKILDFDKEEVRTISLTHAKGSIVCSKVLDEWMVEKPVRTKADGDEVDTILRKLHDGEAETFVAEDAEDEAQYGLDRPEVTVELFVGEKDNVKSLAIGRREGGTYYARDASRDPVFTVDSSLVSLLMKEAADLRDKSILAFEPYEVEQIRLLTEEMNLLCQKDATSTWQIVEPIAARGDESEIQDLLWALEGLEAEMFVSDEPADLAPYGLARPHDRIELWLEGDSTAQILLVGKTSGERVYVKNNTAPSVYLVDSDFLEKAERAVTDFRDKKVLDFYTYEVRKLDVLRGHERSTWEKNSKGEWRGPDGRSAKKGDISQLLSELQSLKVESFVDDDPSDLAPYGLTPPRYTVLLGFDKEPPQSLEIGEQGEGDRTYVKTRDTAAVYEVKSEVVEKIERLLTEKEGM